MYKLTQFIQSFLMLSATTCLVSSIFANPVLNNIGAGQVTIQQSTNSTVINQSSQKAIINWRSFNIGQQESTHFEQPAGGVTLNRISATQGASQIYGRLTATGQIILVNPAGIYFGPSAYVNVGGIIATTANIKDQDFLQGNYKFSEPSSYSGAIVNEGEIIARDNGLVALVAPGVVNKGMIKANLGHVILASGETFTMNFSGDNLINFSIDTPTSRKAKDKDGNDLSDGVKNTGTILADGGKVLVSASAAKGVLDHVINMEGVVQAKSVSQVNGEIIFGSTPNSGVIRIAGKVKANSSSHKGGQVKIIGDQISIEAQADIDVTGTNGGNITIDSGNSGTTVVSGALLAKGLTGVGGNITVLGKNIGLLDKSVIDVSGENGGGIALIGGNAHGEGPEHNATYTFMGKDANIYADALTNGNGGKVVIWSDNFTAFAGHIFATGGLLSGNGGWVETSGKETLKAYGYVYANAKFVGGNLGTWLLDPSNVTITAAANSNGAFSGVNPITFDPTAAANSSIAQASGGTAVDSIVEALNAGTSVVINTTSSSGSPGNITVVDAINKTSGGNASLTLNAGGGSTATLNALISILQPITSSAGTLTLNLTTGTGGVIFGANVNTNGGNLVINSGGPIAQTAGALTVSGSVQVTAATGGISLNQSGNSIANFSGTNNGTGDITINNARAGGFTINGTVANNATGGAITLVNTAGAISTTGIISSQPNGVQNAAGGGLVTVTAGNGLLTIGNQVRTTGSMVFSGTSGVTVNNFIIQLVGGLGNFNASTPGASITFNANNAFNLNAGGVFTGTSGAGAGDIVVNANTINLAAQLGGTNGSFGLARSIFLNPVTAGTTIGFGGAGTGGTLSLTSAELNRMWVGTVKIGNSSAGNITMNPYQKGAFGFADGPSVLTLQTAGSIIGGVLDLSLNDTADFTRVQLIADGNISLTFSQNNPGHLNQVVSAVSSGGSISLSNFTTGHAIDSRSLTSLTGDVTNGISVTGANTISINNAVGSLGGVLVTAPITSGSGAIDLHSSSGNATTIGAGNITTTGNVTINGTTVSTGSVAQPGAGIISANVLSITTVGGLSLPQSNLINSLNSINSGSGNITFTSGALFSVTSITNSVNAGSITISNTGALSIIGNITSNNGNIALSTTSGGYTQANGVAISSGTGTISIGAGGGSAIFNTGTLTSTNNTTAAISILNAANTSLGGISAVNGGLQLGIGGAITGTITQANGSITANSLSLLNTSGTTNLTTTSNNIAVLGAINTGSQALNLVTTANGISQTAAMTAGTFNLNATGVGNVLLTQNNSISNFNVNTNNNVSLVNGVALNLSTSTIGGTFNLVNTGSVTNNGALNISGVTSVSAGAGDNVNLSNAGNNFSTINASGNNITIVDANDLILGTMTPTSSLNVTAGGTLTVNNALNGSYDLTFNASNILLNGATINTATGTQNYNGLVTLAVDTALTGSRIIVNNGMTGNKQLDLTGNYFELNGNLALTSLNATGNGANNTLKLINSNNQQYNLTGASSGSMAIGAIPGTFTNIQSLTAGSGNNTLTGTNGASTWNLVGANAGVVQNAFAFNNIQNLVGGSGGNTFVFANDSAAISGTIDAGSAIASNTFDFRGRTYVKVNLINSIYNGNVLNTADAMVVRYSNVGTLIGNSGFENELVLPTNKPNTVVVTGARAGFVNDPLYYINFAVIRSLTGNDTLQFNITPSSIDALGPSAFINGQIMYFPGFTLFSNNNNNVSQIIVQGNKIPQSDTTADTDPSIENLIIKAYDDYIRRIKIDLYCTAL